MLALALRLVSNVGTMVTIGSVLFLTAQLGAFVQVLLWMLLLLSMFVLIGDVAAYIVQIPSSFTPNSDEIAEYLCAWLTSGGQAAVFTRDLSWARSGSRAAGILKDKARKRELILFVEKSFPFAEELARLGARVITHFPGFIPRSRFTVIDYNKSGSRVAIGLVEDGKHVIRTYDAANQTVVALADDLVSLASQCGKSL